MINVGIAGLGFMGMTHYHAYQKVPGVEPSMAEDILKIAVAHAAHPGCADHELFDARLGRDLLVAEQALEVAERKGVRKRILALLGSVLEIAERVRPLQAHERPHAHGYAQVGVVVEAQQQMVLLGDRALALVVDDPASHLA